VLQIEKDRESITGIHIRVRPRDGIAERVRVWSRCLLGLCLVATPLVVIVSGHWGLAPLGIAIFLLLPFAD
jgi:hypothetical protein